MNVGVLFDLDGVLIDSEDLYTGFWNDMENVHPTGIKDFALKIKGNALFKILEHFDSDEVKKDIVERVHRFEKQIIYPMYDGGPEFLEQLKAHGIPMAIVTSSYDTKMESLYRQYPDFKGYFEAIITGSLVKHSKPHPECYLLAAEKIGVPIENCFVFEDSIQGLESGMNSGATVIGLTTTNPAEKLKGKAHYLFDGINGDCLKLILDAQGSLT